MPWVNTTYKVVANCVRYKNWVLGAICFYLVSSFLSSTHSDCARDIRKCVGAQFPIPFNHHPQTPPWHISNDTRLALVICSFIHGWFVHLCLLSLRFPSGNWISLRELEIMVGCRRQSLINTSRCGSFERNAIYFASTSSFSSFFFFFLIYSDCNSSQ